MAERALATAFVNIVPGTKEMEKYLKGDLAKSAGGSGDDAGNAFGKGFGGAFKKLAGGLIAGALVGQVADFVGSAVKSANALYIEFEGVGSVFGKAAGQVQAFAKTAAASAGISESAALAAAKGFGGFASSAGLGADAAAKFSIDLTQAAGDMASFYGGGTEASLGAIKSALLGSYEPMLQYNQQLTEGKVRAEAFALGLTKSTKEALDPNSKALAVQSLLMKGLGVAQGDFVTYADSFDNAQQTMTANFENMKASIGTSLLPVLGQLVAAINPLIEKAGPLLFNVFQKLIPLFDLVIKAIDKIIPALDPVIEVFGYLIDAVVDLVSTVLPPLIDIFVALMPVVLPIIQILGKLITTIMKPLGAILTGVVVPIFELLAVILTDLVVPILGMLGELLGAVFEALMPIIGVWTDLINTALKPFIAILQKYVMPIILMLMQKYLGVLIGVIEWLGKLFGNFYKAYGAAFVAAFKKVGEILKPFWDFLKPILEGLLSLTGAKPIKLGAIVTTKVDDKAGVFDPKKLGNIDYSKLGGGAGTGDGGKAAAAALKKKKAQDAKDKKGIEALIKSTNTKIAAARSKYNESVTKANEAFAATSLKINQKYDEDVAKATKNRDEDMAKASKEHADNVAKIQKDFANKLADIIQQSKDRLRKAFESVTAVDVGKTFADLATKNVTSLVASLKSKLKQAKDLVANAGALASAGFSQTFIEQVVSQGPDAGNAMAKAILASTPEAQAELQSLFADSEKLSSTGMDDLANAMYEKSGLATQALKDMYSQAQVDLQAALAAELVAYTEKQAEIQKTFDAAMLAAKVDRDAALADAKKVLDEALADATKELNDSLDEIAKDFDEKLKGFASQLKSHAGAIAGVKADIASARALAEAPITTTVVQKVVQEYVDNRVPTALGKFNGSTKMIMMASGGYVDKATPAIIGEAGPEVVTPLKDFERMMGLNARDGGNTVNYYAAPNQSLDAEQALFTAMKRAKVVGAW
jgi:hypothetical protein